MILVKYLDEKYKITKTYNTDSAYDICAKIPNSTINLPPGKRIKIQTGIVLKLPSFWEATIRPRSGLSLKYGITILNSPGTIDSEYNGEINIILINHGELPFKIQDGDRIAQITFQKIPRYQILQIPNLSNNDDSIPNNIRGNRGLRSIGLNNDNSQNNFNTRIDGTNTIIKSQQFSDPNND